VVDARISKVLNSIHSTPKNKWQLVSLAQLVSMSRTSFSIRFRELLGNTPLRYLTQWRMIKAKALLTESNAPVGQIAEDVGYSSEAAFNRALKKMELMTPLKYRQSRRTTL
jgi:transcriptional regulator GlxA family with amidase domain